MRYYHGSNLELDVGTTLVPRGAHYVAEWGNTSFYAALERWRPEGFLPHAASVFLVGDPDDIDAAGGGTEWAFECEPQGPVTRHDLNWGSEVSGLVCDGTAVDDPKVRKAAESYWNGTPHHDESVWEYLTASALIVRVEPYETFSKTPSP